MSADWIKMQKSLPEKPEVWAIAAALNLDSDTVVGKLFRVWCWFDEHTENGNAPSVTKMILDKAVSVTGFCEAMINAGWMIEKRNTISLPNFDRHNGKTSKKRALTNDRVAKLRNAPSVTKALPEKRREEKITIPSGIDDKAWLEYEAYRAALPKKSRLTPKARELAWKMLSAYPMPEQKQIIETSIMNGWTGLFPPKGASNGKTKQPREHKTPVERVQETFARLRASGENLDGGGADLRREVGD
jgi:hypothetical protein